ncbi:hypothetical protein ElyMa_006164900 [Elysia marginata]|uniref:Dipeptidylpeptidase IV N-terminal domain-containing protein n=1 Tax=Elysia marginata TaxID=1093978 RepID=A0AAV4H3A2_9GAST|nr:hypothetical protein ElyMa_006164900 [Elysia marginata]
MLPCSNLCIVCPTSYPDGAVVVYYLYMGTEPVSLALDQFNTSSGVHIFALTPGDNGDLKSKRWTDPFHVIRIRYRRQTLGWPVPRDPYPLQKTDHGLTRFT